MANAIPRRKAARRRRIRRQSALFLSLLALGLAAWQEGIPYVLSLPCWIVEEVELGACPPELREPVAERVGPLIGRPIHEVWRHRVQAVAELQALPPVRTAQLRLAWPNRVAFTVTARQPLLVVPHRERYYPVDEEGLLLGEEGAPRPDLPIVFGLDLGPVQVGQRLPGKTLRPIQGCIRAARERGVDLARLALARDGTVRLCTSWEEVVRLGPVREVGRKLDLFAVAREDLRQQDREFEYIDVSVPDTPVWKPRMSAVSQGDPS